MRIISCNLTGKKHTSRNVPCEDSVCVEQKNGVVCACVADGAGSSKYPHAKQGSQAVTNAVSEFFCEKFDDFYAAVNEIELRKVVAAVCRKALKEEAEKLSLEGTETLASTLLCAAVKGNKLIVCQIGDGVIGCFGDGTAQPLTLPQNGEFAGTTFFVNAPEAYRYIQVRKGFTNNISEIFLMTDGIAETLYDEGTGVFHEDIVRLISLSEKDNGSDLLEETVSKYIVNADEASDDCTMAVINLENTAVNYKCKDKKEKSDPIEIPIQEFICDPEKNETEEKKLPYKRISVILAACLTFAVAALVAVSVLFAVNTGKTSQQETPSVITEETLTAVPETQTDI